MASLNESSYAKCLIYKLTQEIVHVATIDNVHLNVDEVFEYLVDLNQKSWCTLSIHVSRFNC